MRVEPSADPARLEAFLARLYVDSDARLDFLRDRARAAIAAGLTESECLAVAELDAGALELAARGFTHKRRAAQRIRSQRSRGNPWCWFRRALSRFRLRP
jgi:hypothetical protein